MIMQGVDPSKIDKMLEDVSECGKNFIKRLLMKDPKERLSSGRNWE